VTVDSFLHRTDPGSRRNDRQVPPTSGDGGYLVYMIRFALTSLDWLDCACGQLERLKDLTIRMRPVIFVSDRRGGVK